MTSSIRALQIFQDNEQLRLTLRESERLLSSNLRISEEIQQEHTQRRIEERNIIEPELDDEPIFPHQQKDKIIPCIQQGQTLLVSIPDTLVLDEILGNFLSEDVILLILPQLSKSWKKAIWMIRSGALLWKKLCIRAWNPLHLPFKAVNTDWLGRFFNRPRIRLGGVYRTCTMYIQYPGPRNMWTPKDAPSIKVVYNHRFWWFLKNGQLIYTSLATNHPERVMDAMRKVVSKYNSFFSSSSQSSVNTQEAIFWLGSYELQRQDGALFCHVDVKQARHGVKFTFSPSPSGKYIKVISHDSYNFKSPDTLMHHTLPAYELRNYRYYPGFI